MSPFAADAVQSVKQEHCLQVTLSGAADVHLLLVWWNCLVEFDKWVVTCLVKQLAYSMLLWHCLYTCS